MNRPTAPIERTIEKGPGNSKEEVERHPAFGLVGFSRTQGNPGKLFGSHLNNHAGSIRMRVQRAERRHELSRDWIWGSDSRGMIEVEMSFVQFSEMITSMNMGEGVPCTLRRFDGEQIPEIPDDLQTEQEKVAAGFEKRTDELADLLKAKLVEVEKILAKKSLGKQDREDIKWAFGKVIQDVEKNLPFVQQSFVESTEKIANAAKAEVEGFLTNAIHAAGLEGLKNKLLKVAEHKAFGSGDKNE